MFSRLLLSRYAGPLARSSRCRSSAVPMPSPRRTAPTPARYQNSSCGRAPVHHRLHAGPAAEPPAERAGVERDRRELPPRRDPEAGRVPERRPDRLAVDQREVGTTRGEVRPAGVGGEERLQRASRRHQPAGDRVVVEGRGHHADDVAAIGGGRLTHLEHAPMLGHGPPGAGRSLGSIAGIQVHRGLGVRCRRSGASSRSWPSRRRRSPAASGPPAAARAAPLRPPDVGACRVADLRRRGPANERHRARAVHQPHTAQTYAVDSLPAAARRTRRTTTPAWRRTPIACAPSSSSAFTGADESLAMRTILSWAWFRPSPSAWDDGARWFRCDVVGGGDQSAHYVDLPVTTQDLLAERPTDAWLVCAQGATVDGSVKVPCTDKHQLARRDHDRAGRRRRPTTPATAPSRRGPRTSARSRSAPGWTTRSTTTSATPGSSSPSGTPATAAPCAGRGPPREGRARSPWWSRILARRAAPGRRSSTPEAGADPDRSPHPRRPLRRRHRRPSRIRRRPRVPATASAYADALAPTISTQPVPCTGPHTAVNFYVGSYAANLSVDGAAVHRLVATECPERFATFAGGTLEDRRLSLLRTVWFTPTVEQAALGARWYSCVALAIRDSRHLAVLTTRVAGALDTSDGRAHYGLCGTAEPGSRRLRAADLLGSPLVERPAHRRPSHRAATPAWPRSATPGRRSARTPGMPSPATPSTTAGPTSGPLSPSGAAVRRTASAGPRADAESAQRGSDSRRVGARGSDSPPSRRKEAAISRRVGR